MFHVKRLTVEQKGDNMATLGEVFKTMFGIDTNAEYTQPEVQGTPPIENQQPTTVQQETPPPQPPVTPQVDEVSAKKLQDLQAEINTLKAANLALMKQTPIQQEKLSVEDMIYRAVMGEQRKETI